MKRTVFFLFFLVSIACIQAQKSDSGDINVDIERLTAEGDSFSKQKAYDKALAKYKKALAIARDKKNTKQIAFLYKKIGVYHHRNGDYFLAEAFYRKGLLYDQDSANTADLYFNISLIKEALNQQDSVLTYLDSCLPRFEKNKITLGACNSFLYAGRVYKDVQRYEKALHYLIKAYNGYNNFNKKNKLADVCSVLGNVQNRLHNYNQALYYYQEALQLQQENKNEYAIGRTHVNIANTLDNLKLLDSAVFHYKKSLGFLEPESSNLATAKYNLADTYKAIGNNKEAEHYYKQSIGVNKTIKDTLSYLYGYNGLVSLYLQNRHYQKAKTYLDSLIPLAINASDNIVRLNYFENQADYYEKTNRHKDAYKYIVKYNQLYKDIYDSEQGEIVQTLHARFDRSNKENEILKLRLANQNNELQLLEKNRSIRNKNVLLIILILVSVTLIISYYWYRTRQKNIKQELKIERLEAVYEGQETIKKRIARDLHDIIATNFDGLRLRILALKKASDQNKFIDKITDELKAVNQQIRVVSHRLSPLQHIIGNKKFTDIIKSRLSEFQLYSDIFIELENPIPDMLNGVKSVVQNNFYGILLEILNNVEKHSMATKLTINNFVDVKQRLNFIFIDNGIGIEHKSKEGIGLLNIRQRCELIEGRCSFEKVESGTKVHIVLPINKISNGK